jgi:hypothetical protein
MWVSPAGAAVFSASPSSVDLGVAPNAVAVGDLDGDGVADVATTNVTTLPSLLHNDGSANFTDVTAGAVLQPAPNSSTAVAIGDLDGDGLNDLAVAGRAAAGNSLSLYRANADGTYTRATFSGANHIADASAIAIGDLNHDGMADLVVADGTETGDGVGGVTVFLRMTSTATAAAGDYARASYDTEEGAEGVAIGDLNGDGNVDIAVANAVADSVTVLYADDATGTSFTPTTIGLAGATPVSIGVGDLNGDGRPDLAVLGRSSGTVIPLLKDASGNGFTVGTALATGAPPTTCDPGDPSCQPTSPNPRSLAVGDLDGDGRDDIAVANTEQNTVTVFLQDASGGTFSPTTLDVGSFPRSLALADLAGTGKLDIVTANGLGQSLTVLTNTTPQATSTSLTVSPTSSSFGDPVRFTAAVANMGIDRRGRTSPGGTMTFTVDGRKLTPVDLVDGSAMLSTSALGVGADTTAHEIEADYSGDVDHAASSKTISYTVAAATTVDGDKTGDVNVTGTTHIGGAHITGSVVVAAGATLDLEDSTVQGDIVAEPAAGGTDGAAAIRICNTKILGSVTIRSSTGLVVVGAKDAAGCSANTIAKDLTLAANGHGVMAIGNSVGGMVTAEIGNSGPGPFPGDTTTIAQNLPAALVTLSQSSVSFADTIAGASSPSKTITVTNNTPIDLTIGDVALTGDDAGQFKLPAVTSGCRGTTLAEGASCFINVAFSPSAALGPHAASLTITSDAVSSPDEIALSGTAVSAPTADLSAVSAPFGDVDVGTVSDARSVTVTNNGGAALSVTSAILTGGGAAQFAITSNTCTAAIASGDHCAIDVTFNPTLAGDASATLQIASNSGSQPATVALSGHGAVPEGSEPPAVATATAPPPPPAIAPPAPAAPTPPPGASPTARKKVTKSQPVVSRVAWFTSTKAASDGTITVVLRVPAAGVLAVSAKSRLPSIATGTGATHAKTIAFSHSATATASGSSSATVRFRPSNSARIALRRAKHLPVVVSVAFTPTGGKRAVRTKTVTVRGTK